MTSILYVVDGGGDAFVASTAQQVLTWEELRFDDRLQDCF
jgi:hypothetical protein